MNTDAAKPKKTKSFPIGVSPLRYRDDKSKIKKSLAAMIAKEIGSRKMTQMEAAGFLGIQQSRVSELVNGKIENFTLDMLFDLLNALGVRMRMNKNSVKDSVLTKGLAGLANVEFTKPEKAKKSSPLHH